MKGDYFLGTLTGTMKGELTMCREHVGLSEELIQIVFDARGLANLHLRHLVAQPVDEVPHWG
ncbi:hypothetical protein SAMN04488518_11525 [Pseudovibrio ascidiaceicola]|uniref:Uncharacterized protein n=1 Tax=Pseudovibrio ascidiaceicola TaxID=285279 RepID=A0A1I4EGN4_9HYPH|nr:hypothetical protein SAMN04488518_11525 [Pseudovibrio ascidiaceicola]